MIFKLNLYPKIKLISIAVILLGFTVSNVYAEQFDLGPFKGKLSGYLTFSSNKNFKKYRFSIINMENGNVNQVKNFDASLSDIELYEPEISPDRKHVLFTGNYIEKQTQISKIFKLNLKDLKTTSWQESKLNISNPRYSKNGENIVFTQFYNSDFAKNIIYNLKTNKFTELKCPEPKQCATPNWDDKNEHILFTNKIGLNLSEINIKLNKTIIQY